MFKGGAIPNPKYNAGIDFNSGFRKTSQGGGGAIYIYVANIQEEDSKEQLTVRITVKSFIQ